MGGSQASPTLFEAGDLDLARELVKEVKERASQLDTPAALASAEGAEATLAGWMGDAALGRRLAHESLALSESIGEIGDAFWTMLGSAVSSCRSPGTSR